MRIAVLSDLHANLPFAEAAVSKARKDGCDRIIHLGDAIDLGPWPAETLDYLDSEGVECIRGNHDEYPIFGVPDDVRRKLPRDILLHFEWTAAQLQERHIGQLLAMPLRVSWKVDEWNVRFTHYLTKDDRVSSQSAPVNEDALCRSFGVAPGEIVCFGHTHRRLWSFMSDRALLNPGAAGFLPDGDSGYAVLAVRDIGVWVEWHQVPASQELLHTELERRQVPAWRDTVHRFFDATPA
jgi:predicted phosphodiesterase